MNNDTVKLLDVLDLIVNIDVAIIPYEKVREYVDAVRLYLIKKVRELPVNEGELNLQELKMQAMLMVNIMKDFLMDCNFPLTSLNS